MRYHERVKVELSEETIAAAQRVVARGQCSSIEEALSLGMWVLAGRNAEIERFFEAVEADPVWMAEIQQKIADGLADVDAGRVVPGEIVHARARELLRRKASHPRAS